MARQYFSECELAILHLTFVIPSEMERSAMKSRNLSLFLICCREIVRDVSTSLDMTKRLLAPLLIGYATLCSTLSQESPTATPSPTPEQTASASPARNVRLSFVPPPMEGTISL